MIKWTDINEIAIELADNHQDIDPKCILTLWICVI